MFTYRLLLRAHCLLRTAFCVLPTAFFLLPTAFFLLPSSYCLLTLLKWIGEARGFEGVLNSKLASLSD